MTHFWHQEYDFWSSPLKACLPPEGRILCRVFCVLKKNQNAPRPSDVILCLDCRRIALIGTCLLNLRILIGTCLLNLGILIGTCLLKPVPLTFELAIDPGSHLCTAVVPQVDSMRRKPWVRNYSRERKDLYNGNVQQNPLCAASCVTKDISISPRFSPTVFIHSSPS